MQGGTAVGGWTREVRVSGVLGLYRTYLAEEVLRQVGHALLCDDKVRLQRNDVCALSLHVLLLQLQHLRASTDAGKTLANLTAPASEGIYRCTQNPGKCIRKMIKDQLRK